MAAPPPPSLGQAARPPSLPPLHQGGSCSDLVTRITRAEEAPEPATAAETEPPARGSGCCGGKSCCGGGNTECVGKLGRRNLAMGTLLCLPPLCVTATLCDAELTCRTAGTPPLAPLTKKKLEEQLLLTPGGAAGAPMKLMPAMPVSKGHENLQLPTDYSHRRNRWPRKSS